MNKPTVEQIAAMIAEDDELAGLDIGGGGDAGSPFPGEGEGEVGGEIEPQGGIPPMEEIEPITMDKNLLQMLCDYCCTKKDEDPECCNKVAQAALDHSKVEAGEGLEGAEGEEAGGIMTGEEDFQEIIAMIEGEAGGEEMGGEEMGGGEEIGGEEGLPFGGEGGEEEMPFEARKSLRRVNPADQMING